MEKGNSSGHMIFIVNAELGGIAILVHAISARMASTSSPRIPDYGDCPSTGVDVAVTCVRL